MLTASVAVAANVATAPAALVASSVSQLFTARSESAAAKRSQWPIAQVVMKPP